MADDNKLVGTVTHFYDKISVAILKLEASVKKGDKLKFSAGDTDFEQTISDMQFDHQDIDTADAGQEVGIKVDQKAKKGSQVYFAE